MSLTHTLLLFYNLLFSFNVKIYFYRSNTATQVKATTPTLLHTGMEDVRYNLLELACLPRSTSNVTAVDCLTTRTMTTNPNGAMDHALSWHLYQTMRSIGLQKNSNDKQW